MTTLQKAQEDALRREQLLQREWEKWNKNAQKDGVAQCQSSLEKAEQRFTENVSRASELQGHARSPAQRETEEFQKIKEDVTRLHTLLAQSDL